MARLLTVQPVFDLIRGSREVRFLPGAFRPWTWPALSGRVAHVFSPEFIASCHFTSTRAVYANFTHPVLDEHVPLGIPGVPREEWTRYGPLNALAEEEVQAAFMVHKAEEAIRGTFDVEAPAAPLTSAEFLHGLRATTGAPVSFTWVPWDFLEAQGLRGGMEIPAWRAPEGEWLNYGRMGNRRAIAAGMTFRPLAVTAMDILAWWKERARTKGASLRAGYSPEREREVVTAWAEGSRSS